MIVSLAFLFFSYFGSIGSQREVAMDSLQISLFLYLFCYRDTPFAG